MRTLGAILTSSPGKWQVAELDLDAPRQGELMVKLAAAGLCYSDDHMATGDLIFGTYPFCGGPRRGRRRNQVGA
jgi:Zn-dependent alcohol dehydrogenase